MVSSKKVWFVTDALKGLGLSLVRGLAASGDMVAATSCDGQALVAAVGEVDGFLPLEVDLGDEAAIGRALEAVRERWGRVDVVVNNAGHGTRGALEEVSEADIVAGFDVNLFATMRVIRRALPVLRIQGGGHIVNIFSIAGFVPGVGWSVYAAAKAAVVGLSESLAQELVESGIKVTVVLPSERLVDPEKAAVAIGKLVNHAAPPVHLFLGGDAYTSVYTHFGEMAEQMETWKSVAVSTTFAGRI